MEFCSVCQNLLTIQSRKDDAGNEFIVNFCRCCNFEKSIPNSTNTSVFKKTFGKNKKLFKDLYISKYTKDDPTLPKINIECTKCKNKDVVFVRTDEDNMNYLYVCRNVNCNYNWAN